jgi:DNA adenine methylase
MFPYIGGKKHHSRWIDPFFPENTKTYVEVFGGAMWMYWMSGKLPSNVNVYNDFNRHLANVFLCSSTDPAKMEETCKKYYTDLHNADTFTKYRDEVFAVYSQQFATPDYDLAAKYMLCQLQIFAGGNGLTDKSKIYINENYKAKFKTFTEKFQQVKYLDKLSHLTVENIDCRDLIRKYDHADTFFYIDPPYFKLESYYTEDEFGKLDHIELLEMLKHTKGKWALSYYYFPELENMLPRDEYYWHEEVTFTNNGLAKQEGALTKDGKPADGVRPERTELLIMNYDPVVIVDPVNNFDDLFDEN